MLFRSCMKHIGGLYQKIANISIRIRKGIQLLLLPDVYKRQGFVTESVESYNRVCWNLAKHTKHVVVSIDYPLAPEHRFPTQIEDCYAVAKAVFTDRSILNTVPEAITIMGDSAGGNLAAAVSLMARDRGEFLPLRQILIYPCVNNNYEENNGFP